MSNGIPAIVQQVNQEQDQRWLTLVQEIVQLDVKEKNAALRMGDIFVEVEQMKPEQGKKFIKEAARLAGVSLALAMQRYWVSSKIPPDSPIRKKRFLSYTHLRHIAGTDDPERWATVAEEEQLTVRDLIERIDQAGDRRQVIDMEEKCAGCERKIEDPDQIVAITITPRGQRRRCCNVGCAKEYLDRFDPQSQRPVDPFLARVDLEEALDAEEPEAPAEPEEREGAPGDYEDELEYFPIDLP